MLFTHQTSCCHKHFLQCCMFVGSLARVSPASASECQLIGPCCRTIYLGPISDPPCKTEGIILSLNTYSHGQNTTHLHDAYVGYTFGIAIVSGFSTGTIFLLLINSWVYGCLEMQHPSYLMKDKHPDIFSATVVDS